MEKIRTFIMAKKLLTLILAGVILILIFVAYLLLKPKPQNTYTVKREDLVNTVDVTGTYTTASQSEVNSPTNGVITKLYVANGQQVNKGDPLFFIESTATAQEQKSAYADYLAASAAQKTDTAQLYALQSSMYAAWKKYTDIATNSTFENSDKTPNSTNRVLPEFTTAQDDWLAAEANYKNQQSVIAKDNAALAAAKQRYDQTQSVTVNAPTSGTVINLASQIHDAVSAPNPTTQNSTPVLLIEDARNPVLISQVDQVNIPKLTEGDRAKIVFDALPDTVFTGRVTHIDATGTKTQGTVTFDISVTINTIPKGIRPNMTATITIETARQDNVLTVPNDAIITKNGQSFVELAGHGQNNLTKVTLGLKGLTKTEVTQGLTSGDNVIEQE